MAQTATSIAPSASISERARISQAHQHAANADEHLAQGYLILACDEHRLAAEAYAAVDVVSNDSLRNTLRMLEDKHRKAVKELERKIAKLENKDPHAQIKPDPPVPRSYNQPQPFSAAARVAHTLSTGIPRSVPSPPPLSKPMSDSHSVDESFMLLGGQKSDPGDAFNQFWNIMQGMLDNLDPVSQPVAFATAPLGQVTPLRRDENLSSDEEDLVPSKATPNVNLIDHDDEKFDEGDELSESFYLIDESPSSLKRENSALKAQLTELQTKIATVERTLQARKDHDQQLKESIVLARREAQRAMGASTVLTPRGMDFGTLNLPLAIPGVNTSREAQYARRIRELEDELRGVKSENEKQKLMITKFRERWEKLKDSAKRKKEAKAAVASGLSVARDRIVEEAEEDEDIK